jgi:hypothetical protein
MSIRSTQYITRSRAIQRIIEINQLANAKNYREIDNLCFESENNIQEFVDNYIPIDTSNIENWTDTMLANKMDEAFFRNSMFDNYQICGDKNENI